jgi:abequosyltransferase
MTKTLLPGNRLLSAAIPVYNFSNFLPETLDSLLDQTAAEGVGVLVFDGGSTDNTQSIVTGYMKRYSHLRYVKALKKGGIDFDMARCVELVGAQYCWLFSGDDVMQPYGIKEVLEALTQWRPDLLLLRHNECHFNMSVIKDWPVLNIVEDKLFLLNDDKDRRQYLEAALTSEAFFSFMGGLVVKRSTWFRERLDPAFVGSNWAHIGRLWSLSNSPFKLGYLHQVMLNRRGGNDSFSNQGMLTRLEIQISGLLGVIEALYDPRSLEMQHLKRVVKGEVEPNWTNAVREDLKNRNAPPEQFEKLDQMLERLKD